MRPTADNTQSAYLTLSRNLSLMKQEYEIMPSTFLKKKIELIEDKMNKINASVGKYQTPIGNYSKAK